MYNKDKTLRFLRWKIVLSGPVMHYTCPVILVKYKNITTCNMMELRQRQKKSKGTEEKNIVNTRNY